MSEFWLDKSLVVLPDYRLKIEVNPELCCYIYSVSNGSGMMWESNGYGLAAFV